MYYVSYIEEFPVYEPAEGGYYYAGENVAYCRAFDSWKKANKHYQKIKRELMQEWEACDTHEYSVSGCNIYGSGSHFRKKSRYIGEEEYLQITRYKPQYSGYHPYE